ncbi:MAG: hypothetical protein RLZZ219_476 [Cyanobacteriota bacterium]
MRSGDLPVLLAVAILGLALFVWRLDSTGLVDEAPPLFAAAARDSAMNVARASAALRVTGQQANFEAVSVVTETNCPASGDSQVYTSTLGGVGQAAQDTVATSGQADLTHCDHTGGCGPATLRGAGCDS